MKQCTMNEGQNVLVKTYRRYNDFHVGDHEDLFASRLLIIDIVGGAAYQRMLIKFVAME